MGAPVFHQEVEHHADAGEWRPEFVADGGEQVGLHSVQPADAAHILKQHHPTGIGATAGLEADDPGQEVKVFRMDPEQHRFPRVMGLVGTAGRDAFIEQQLDLRGQAAIGPEVGGELAGGGVEVNQGKVVFHGEDGEGDRLEDRAVQATGIKGHAFVLRFRTGGDGGRVHSMEKRRRLR